MLNVKWSPDSYREENGLGILVKVLFVSFCFLFSSCDSNEKTKEANVVKADTSSSIQPNHLAVKTTEQLTDAKGVIGVFDVPEMLTITKMDSTNMSGVAALLAKNYLVLQKDIDYIKAEINGSAGAIYYNNDTSNFIFECVIPIAKMPTVQPKKSQVVVLEATKMLVYNYYGPYYGLYSAYAEIKDYCNKYKIEQSGPLREFYITDPTTVKDSMQWLTRIMLPVK